MSFKLVILCSLFSVLIISGCVTSYPVSDSVNYSRVIVPKGSVIALDEKAIEALGPYPAGGWSEESIAKAGLGYYIAKKTAVFSVIKEYSHNDGISIGWLYGFFDNLPKHRVFVFTRDVIY